jgi:hypothetical protein
MLVLRLTERQQAKVSLEAKSFKQEQQTCASAIAEVMAVYQGTGFRKPNASSLPLRFEVDSFLARIVDKFIGKEGPTAYPLLAGTHRERFILQNIEKWEDVEDKHLLDKAANLYPQLQNTFGTVAAIHSASEQQIGESLKAIRSFYSAARYSGGYQAHVDKLFAQNDPSVLRDQFAYLLHGRDAFEYRLAIFTAGTDYKIKGFGPSAAKELLGWCNKEGIMLFTDKTKKALRYLGFDIAIETKE